MLSSLHRTSTANRRPLRIGVVLDGNETAPQLFSRILEDIAESNFARIQVAIILNGSEKPRRAGWLFDMYHRWDRARLPAGTDPFEPVNLRSQLDAVETIAVDVDNRGLVPDSAVDSIRTQEIDVLLRLCSAPLAGGILEAARHGVWFFQFGDGASYAGDPPYFWEVRNGSPLSGAVLRLSTAGASQSRVLCRGQFESVLPTTLSWAQNRVRPGWTSAAFVIQKLFTLHQQGSLPADPEPLPETEPAARSAGAPNSWELVRWLAPQVGRKIVRRATTGKLADHWRMAIRQGARRLWDGECVDAADFTWIESPRGEMYADPFLISHQNRTWLFFENYGYARKRAVIDCAEVLEDGRLRDQRTVLDCDYHLSFPLVFEHDGEFFMLPETGANKTVELYRASHFPFEWKLEKVLLRGQHAADTAPWFDGDRWWFFAPMKDRRGQGTMLMLFHAASLTADWKLHPASPISVDIRHARGAGALFLQDGRLLRPSQDCSRSYGFRLNFHEITELTPDRFTQRPVLTVDPSRWGNLTGLHTYNQCHGAEVIDGCFELPRKTIAGQAD